MACGFCSATQLSTPCPICATPAQARQKPQAGRGRAKSAPRARPAATAPRAAPAPAQAPRPTPPPVPRCSRCGIRASQTSQGPALCGSCLMLPSAPVRAPQTVAARSTPRGGAYRAAPVAETDAAPVAAPTTWEGMTPEARAYHLTALRKMEAAGQLNAAAATLAKLADVRHVQGRVLLLTEIDARAARLGRLAEGDLLRRSQIIHACLGELGFDPRAVDGPLPVAGAQPAAQAWEQVPRPAVAAPKAAPVLEVVPTPAALPEGEAGPLKAGDWRGLFLRVQRGHLTEADAQGFAAVWQAQGL